MKINQLLKKSTAEIIVKKDLEDKLRSGRTLKVKLGIDPTGSDLHLGHMVVIRKLKEFQELGHTVQLLFGNFTGQIGDPTDKKTTRQVKTQEELENNAKKYLEQVGKVLDTSKVEVHWNADWLGNLKFIDIINLAQTFTVQQMIERDMFQERINNQRPIYMHEFFYPLMQGYDSVALKSDVELGGTDQTFNLLAGRTIQKAYGQEPQNILTVPLLIGTDGQEKMGKSLNNYIGINEEPSEMYGKTMSIPDHLILPYFELATDIPLEEIEKIKQAMAEGENPKNIKMRLAREIVTLYHNHEAALHAEIQFNEIFKNKGIPEEIELYKLANKQISIIDIIAESGMTNSKGEARRLILGGGVKVDGEKISDGETQLNPEEKDNKEIILQVGKRKFLKIIS